jgi:hypothetical protein
MAQGTDAPDLRRLITRPRRRDPNFAQPAPVWMFVAVPVVVVGAVLGLAVLVRGADPPHHHTTRRPASAPSRADTAVRTYLRALAGDDAATAIAMSSPTPSGRLLTRGVLAAQQRIAPLHDIVVTDRAGSGSRDDVDVQYWSGRRHVRTRMAVVKSHGQWRVQYGTVPIDVRYERRRVPGLAVWGHPITEDVIHVFPGPLRYTSSDPDLAVIDQDAADYPVEPTAGWGAPYLDVRLSRSGRARAIVATVAVLRSCASATRLAPDGCPQRMYDYEALGSGISWRLVGDPARDLDADFDGPTYRRVRVSGDVHWAIDYAARRFGGALDRKHADVTSFVDGTVDLASSRGFALD